MNANIKKYNLHKDIDLYFLHIRLINNSNIEDFILFAFILTVQRWIQHHWANFLNIYIGLEKYYN